MKVAGAVVVAAGALWLPEETYSAELARSRGLVPPADFTREGFERLPVAGEPPPEMACLAAQRALAAAGVRPEELDLVVHAWVHDQGPATWTPPHRVARRLNAVDCPAVGVRQMSNGGAAALQLGVAHLLAEPRAASAVVTTADAFGALPYDRWESVPPLGDGAAAAVLTRRGGPQVIDSIVSTGDNGLELAYPTSDPFERRSTRYERPSMTTLREIGRCVRRSVDEALEDAGLTHDSPGIGAVLLPRVGRTLQSFLTARALPPGLRDKVVLTGQRTGHLGAGDMLANLAEHPPPADGIHHVHVGFGAGFTGTCLVVRGVRAAQRNA